MENVEEQHITKLSNEAVSVKSGSCYSEMDSKPKGLFTFLIYGMNIPSVYPTNVSIQPRRVCVVSISLLDVIL